MRRPSVTSQTSTEGFRLRRVKGTLDVAACGNTAPGQFPDQCTHHVPGGFIKEGKRPTSALSCKVPGWC